MKLKCCVICETPYNIFNAVKHFYGTSGDYSTDIFIGDNLAYLFETIKSVCLFDNVYIFKNHVDENFNKLAKALRSLNPRWSANNALEDNDKIKRYDEIYIFSATKFPTDIIYSNRTAIVKYLEDGMDSYIGRICTKPCLSIKSKIINFIARKDVSRIEPKEVFLNAPELCDSNQEYEIKRINNAYQNNDEINAILKKIFGYKDTGLYDSKRVFYLGQAFVADGMGEKIEVVEERISEQLMKYNEHIIYRKHPREDKYSSNWKCIDNGENMWEIVCQEHICNESVLISCFSTALLTPKLLYDKEPWLIYTYKLYKDYFVENNAMTAGLNNGIATMIKKLQKIYRNPRKIICIESVNEVGQILDSIKRREKSNV